jgi:hypothetical protein
MSVLDKKVSWFRSYHDPHPAGETTLLRWLTGFKLKDKVLAIRNAPDKATADAMKAQLPAITPSGTFSKRRDDGLLAHSGFICIDIDLKGNEQIRNYAQLKEQLSRIKQVAYCGLSVSGNGYFALIPIAYPEKHLQHFLALEAVFAKIGIRLDEKCKNLSRLRGYSWDADPYINHQATPFTGLLEKHQLPSKPILHARPSYQAMPPMGNTDAERVEALLQTIEAKNLDLTEDYNYWFAIACNFAATFGESGRQYFHRVSAFHPKYNPGDCDHKFDEALKKTSGANPDLGAFINRCKDAGIYVTLKTIPVSPPKQPQQPAPEAPIPTPPTTIVNHSTTPEPAFSKPIVYKRPKPKPVEIPLYIKELEEKLNTLTRPLPQLTISPGVKVSDPVLFISSHMATLKNNFSNQKFSQFLFRLHSFLDILQSNKMVEN